MCKCSPSLYSYLDVLLSNGLTATIPTTIIISNIDSHTQTYSGAGHGCDKWRMMLKRTHDHGTEVDVEMMLGTNDVVNDKGQSNTEDRRCKHVGRERAMGCSYMALHVYTTIFHRSNIFHNILPIYQIVCMCPCPCLH